STFVSTSGPITAYASPSQTSQLRSPQFCAPSWLAPTSASGSHMTSRTSALIRYGEYRRMSGAIVTEYTAQAAAIPRTSRSPPRSADRLAPDPTATSATPPNVTRAAIQNWSDSCSSPTADATRAVKMGVVPRISATVVAVVSFNA